MNKQQTNGIQGKPKSELWIPIAYAIFYFPTFEWLNAHNFPRYYIGCRLDDLIPFCEWFVIPYVVFYHSGHAFAHAFHQQAGIS